MGAWVQIPALPLISCLSLVNYLVLHTLVPLSSRIVKPISKDIQEFKQNLLSTGLSIVPGTR